MARQKLELTWIGKENRPKLEPRILLEEPARSYHAAHRVTDKDIFDNRLIFGDNLLALKALEADFAGRVKCVFIDPPYNTGSAFTHYDDGVEHSIWLSLMRDRLEIIRSLLSEDGSLWITIDDNEAHYLKVLCDEVFGRANFVANAFWQKTPTRENRTDFSAVHDHVLVFAKCREIWKEVRNPLPASESQLGRFTNPDNDPRGPWASLPAHAKAEKGRRQAQFFTVTTPSGRKVDPPAGRCWLYTEPRFREMVADNRIWFGADGGNAPRVKKFLSEVQAGLVPSSFWSSQEVGTNGQAKAELVNLFPGETPFSTPKPEALVHRAIHIATNPGDLVLDSFAGSGTTGAVAHKMGRHWIMVELGEHCHTHIIPRLKKVIDGEDAGGITEAVGWKGGGGFRYYHLAPSLLEQDRWGQWVINKQYNAAMLAEALCKLEGFTYAPSDAVYWQHGHSTERDFVYVTTATLTHEQLQALSEEVGSERSLLVLCLAFRGRGEYPNLTVKKIPKQVLSRCEWGHDDYSLRVENLPAAPVAAVPSPPPPLLEGEGSKRGQPGLFDEVEP
jgi:adenine-specific DNA-methyltransferase